MAASPARREGLGGVCKVVREETKGKGKGKKEAEVGTFKAIIWIHDEGNSCNSRSKVCTNNLVHPPSLPSMLHDQPKSRLTHA